MINWNDLKIFETVAATGNFTKAAQAMHTVQSNVTARIKVLEDEFKVSFFDRTTRTVVLTGEGEKFIQYCKKISRLTEQIKQELASSEKLSGTLKIGSIETTMALKIPELINHFVEKYPEVNLSFQSDQTPNLIEEVLNHRLDAAFVAAPVVRPELHTHLVKKEKLVVVSSAKHPSVNDYIKAQPIKIIVFDKGCSYRPRLEVWLNTKGVLQYQCIVMNTLDGIINFVEAGIGITILPVDLIHEIYPGRKLKTYPISGELGLLSTVLVYRKNQAHSKTMDAFLDLFKDEAT